MGVMSILSDVPIWGVLFAVGLSCYYAYRGFKGNLFTLVEDNEKRKHKLSRRDMVTVFCIHDALFHFLCSLAGFLALLVSLKIYKSLDFAQPLDTGKSLLLAFSFLFGVIGATGQLPQLILQGKLPFMK